MVNEITIGMGIGLIWAIGTTIYGLFLQRRNNEKYNKKIVELLESINRGINNGKNNKL